MQWPRPNQMIVPLRHVKSLQWLYGFWLFASFNECNISYWLVVTSRRLLIWTCSSRGFPKSMICSCNWIAYSPDISKFFMKPESFSARKPSQKKAQKSPRSLNRSILADFENDISDGVSRRLLGTQAEANGSHGDDHSLGKCQPCVFRHSSNGCPFLGCCYCHQDHPPIVLKQRVRKRTRDKIKEKLREIVHSEQALDSLHKGSLIPFDPPLLFSSWFFVAYWETSMVAHCQQI